MGNLILMGDSTNAWHNLAVESALFEAQGKQNRVLYLWQNRNTVVIGRHQNAWKECRVKLLEDEGGRLARRSSGGGAVYHDLGNLNFSFVVPRHAYDLRRQLEVVRRAVAQFGIEAQFTGRNDLVIAGSGAKFSGNAFRFSNDVALHHGTLMVNVALDRLGRYLAPDDGKLKAKGIDSVRARVANLAGLNPEVTVSSLEQAMRQAFTAEFGPADALSMDDLDAVRLAALEREYGSWAFRLGKTLPFDATLQRRFSWGGVTLELGLKGGAVISAQAYSDAMDEAMIARLAPALTGVRYENQALGAALRKLNHPQANELAEWLENTDLGGHAT
uniref:lipoate--protein ligase n=1 Tax=uncultured bacterium Contigcl_47 TaxID=1393673 RepID=W0FLA2_9BACT|nr:lipoyltransferase and lipoate-protein ligase [uncultured bacterium Contigcl_47]